MSLSRYFRRAAWDDERARELDAHLALEIDEQIGNHDDNATPPDLVADLREHPPKVALALGLAAVEDVDDLCELGLRGGSAEEDAL